MKIISRVFSLIIPLSLTIGCSPQPATQNSNANSAYHVITEYKIGGAGRWDYLSIDSQTKRLYVPRSDRVTILNADDGTTIGEIPNTKGIHGVALVTDINRGFTSNGADGTLTIFDLKSLKALGTVKAGDKPDAIIYDPATRHVLALNGQSKDMTAVEAAVDPANAQTQKVDLGGQPEFAAADGAGHVFVNLEDTSEIVRVDLKELKVTDRWSLAPGEEPTGLAIDTEHHRLFVGCHNKMMAVLDAKTGKVITTLPIGEGVDACAFDPATQLAFASNGDGTLTVIHEDSPDKFTVVQNVRTRKGARTMALDPVTHRIYMPTAEFAPATQPAAGQARPRPSIVPNSFTILVVDR